MCGATFVNRVVLNSLEQVTWSKILHALCQIGCVHLLWWLFWFSKSYSINSRMYEAFIKFSHLLSVILDLIVSVFSTKGQCNLIAKRSKFPHFRQFWRSENTGNWIFEWNWKWYHSTLELYFYSQPDARGWLKLIWPVDKKLFRMHCYEISKVAFNQLIDLKSFSMAKTPSF